MPAPAWLFDKVILQCSEAGLVSGRHLSGDGTQVRAGASTQSLELVIEAAEPSRDAWRSLGRAGRGVRRRSSRLRR
jgi:hypothetical protein